MKKTWQKDMVLDTVKNMRNHPTADEVYRALCEKNIDIGIATVYRNLNSFAGCGLVRKVIIPDAADRFDYRLDEHEHFLCQRCGRVKDADVKVKIISENENVKFSSYALTLFGLCEECTDKD